MKVRFLASSLALPWPCSHFVLARRCAALFALIALTLSAIAGESATRRPNIVFILVDDMGWKDGGCFGSRFYETPNIDALAATGMRFTQAYAACAVCSPTRAALMTGKAPARMHITDWISGEGTPKQSRFQVPDWQKYLPLEETTLAEALKSQGYATEHLGKWHVGGGKFLPQNQGFDFNVGGGEIGHPASYFWPYGEPNKSHRVPDLAERGGKEGDYLTDQLTDEVSHRVPDLAERGGKEGDYLTDQLTDEALKFIEANKDRPFYLNFCHYAVHAPLMGKQEWIDKAAERSGAEGQSNKTYYAMLRSVDESVGRVVKKLRDLHLADHTLLVFTSDNGGAVHLGNPPATSNAPLRKGKGYAYEGGLRVPLIVSMPGVTQPGSVCDTPVVTMDFFPTLLELAGAAKSASATAVDGVSIVPLLHGREQSPHGALFWHYPHYWNGMGVTPYSVARVGNWKLIRFYETGTEELYDLSTDLSETHDLAQNQSEKRKELGLRLDAWLKDVGAQMPVPKTEVPAR